MHRRAAFGRRTSAASRQQWPGRFLEIYGLTEGGCSCMLDVTRYPDKLHTVGRARSRTTTFASSTKTGATCRRANAARSSDARPMMMSGYFRNPEATEAFYWRDKDGTIYHRTGDIGVFDEDGFLTLVDRKKDVIISGGFNVYASDLEGILLKHPDDRRRRGDRRAERQMGRDAAWSAWSQARRHAFDRPNCWTGPMRRLGKMQRLSAIELRERTAAFGASARCSSRSSSAPIGRRSQ